MNINSFLTGSSTIVSSLHFLDSGELVIENVDSNMLPEDSATLIVTQEYLLYALDRDDWMASFLELMKKNAEDIIDSQRPDLELIHGGLSDPS